MATWDERATSCNSYAHLRGAAGSLSGLDLEAVMQEQHGECVGCAESLDDGWWQVDHITSIARGGQNRPSNIQLLCGQCNEEKGTLSMAEWISPSRSLEEELIWT